MKAERIADDAKRKKPWRVRVDTGLRNSSGSKIYKQAFGATAAEAREEAKLIIANLQSKPSDNYLRNKKFTLRNAADDLEKDWNALEAERFQNPNKGLNPDSVKRNKEWIKLVFNCGFINEETQLATIDKLYIRNLLNDLRSCDLSDSKTTRIWRYFNQIIDSAVMSDYIDFNPAKVFKKNLPSYKAARKKAHTIEDMRNVYKHIVSVYEGGTPKQQEAALIFIIECFTGLRWGEAAALTVNDFDFANCYINVNKSKSSSNAGFISKTKSSQLRMSEGNDGDRLVPFPKALENLLRDYIRLKRHYLFAVSYSYCADFQKLVRKKLNLEYFTTRSFRKFVPTQYRKLGADSKDTQALLGHKDEETQDDYITYDVPTKFTEDIYKKLN